MILLISVKIMYFNKNNARTNTLIVKRFSQLCFKLKIKKTYTKSKVNPVLVISQVTKSHVRYILLEVVNFVIPK